MSKKLYIILSAVVLAATVAVVAIFFVILNKDTPAVDNLTVYAMDLTLKKGEKSENFYRVSDVNAVVTFTIEKPNIVEIEDDDIYGVNKGTTSVTIIATNSTQTAQTTISVTVEDVASCTIEAKKNCTIADGVVYASTDTFQLIIKYFDNLGNQVLNYSFDAQSSTNDLIYQMNSGEIFVFKVSSSCTITLNFDNGKLVFSFDVIL